MKFNRMLATINGNIIDLEKQLRREREEKERESLRILFFLLSLLFL